MAAASDADSVDDDDVIDDDDEDQSATFDVAADVSRMTEAERRKWDKKLAAWRLFVDFLVRHIAVVTFKFNSFERDESVSFALALRRAEGLRMLGKLKVTLFTSG